MAVVPEGLRSERELFKGGVFNNWAISWRFMISWSEGDGDGCAQDWGKNSMVLETLIAFVAGM